MEETVVIIGIGEIGGVLARGVLKAGYPIYPVVRGTDLAIAAGEVGDPRAVIVAVTEKDMHGVLEAVPHVWRRRLVLVQNELLPRDWQAHGIKDPTVISVWFEKKPGQDVKVIIPSPVFGPCGDFMQSALNAVNIACHVIDDSDGLLFELAAKNVYILTANIAGLAVGSTVGELWRRHQALAREVAEDIMDIQFCLIGKKLDRERLITGMVRAFHGDPGHMCMGRSAPARLARAVAQADAFGLDATKLREIQRAMVFAGPGAVSGDAERSKLP